MITAASPVKINNTVVKNRLTFAPTVKFDWTDNSGIAIDRFAKHYGDRAKGGCGLICVEATCIAPDGRICPSQIGLWSDEHIEGHSKITEACHEYGSVVIVQIQHSGANTHPECGPSKGPSANPGRRGMSEELTLDEIHTIREQFIAAAVRAKKAGYDGVQLHACHGYLFNQFTALSLNHRTDEYGGNTENRARLGCEVIRGIREVCGDDFIISARVPGAEPDVDEAIAVCEQYVAAGCDYLQVSTGIDTKLEPIDDNLPYNGIVNLGIRVHEHFKGRVPVSCVNSITKAEQVNYLIENELVDTIDLARALLADPRFCNGVISGAEYINCMQCKSCFWNPFMPHRCPVVAMRHKLDPDCSDFSDDKRPIPDFVKNMK